MNDKAQFYWAVIGDANPEPVAVTIEDGKRVAYTIGCEDPFSLEGEDVNIRLIPQSWTEWRDLAGLNSFAEDPELKPLEVPVKPEEHQREREEAEKRLERDRKRGIRHGWRRWNP